MNFALLVSEPITQFADFGFGGVLQPIVSTLFGVGECKALWEQLKYRRTQELGPKKAESARMKIPFLTSNECLFSVNQGHLECKHFTGIPDSSSVCRIDSVKMHV